MKMIDVTNSHYDLVTKQLECSDASIVKVYTLGPTTSSSSIRTALCAPRKLILPLPNSSSKTTATMSKS